MPARGGDDPTRRDTTAGAAVARTVIRDGVAWKDLRLIRSVTDTTI